jgi:hypothetical protein
MLAKNTLFDILQINTNHSMGFGNLNKMCVFNASAIASTDFDKMYNDSYFTIMDIGDPQKAIDFLSEEMEEAGIGVPKKWFTFTGSDMNDHYGLSDDFEYENSIVFLSFPLDGLESGPLYKLKLRLGADWFNDIVDHNTNYTEDDDIMYDE